MKNSRTARGSTLSELWKTGRCREFEETRRQFGEKAEDFITECYRLHAALALSLRPAKSSDALKERLMKMVREKKQRDAH